MNKREVLQSSRRDFIRRSLISLGIEENSPTFNKCMDALAQDEQITTQQIASQCVQGYLTAQGINIEATQPQSTPKWLVPFVGGSMVLLLVSCVVLAIVAIIKSKQQPNYEPVPAIVVEEATVIPTATVTVIPEKVRLARDWNDYVNRIGQNDPRSVFDGTTKLKPSKILTNPSVRGFAAIIEDPRTTGAMAKEAAVFLGSIMTKTLGINEGDLQTTPQKFVSRISWSSLPPSPAPVTFPTESPSATAIPKATNRGGQEQATAVPTKTNTPTATPTSTATTTVTVTPTAPLGLGMAKTATPTKWATATATRTRVPVIIKNPTPIPSPTSTATPTSTRETGQANIGEVAGEEGEGWVKRNLWDPFQDWVTAPLTPSPTVTSPPTPRPTSTQTPRPTEEETPDCNDWRTGGEQPCER